MNLRSESLLKKYNLFRPVLLLAVAFLTYNVVSLICITFGVNEEAAGNYAFLAMMIAAIFTYMRINKRNRRS